MDGDNRHMPKVRDVDPGEGLPQYIGALVKEARIRKARAATPQEKAKGETWSQSYVATRVFVGAHSRISDVETGEVPPDMGLAHKLEVTLDLPPGTLTHLVRIMHQGTVQDYAQGYLKRQEEAEIIHTASFIVPGLLQTPDYARALLATGETSPKAIELYVEQRMERQRVLEREHPPWLSFVLDESALHHASTTQLQRLLDAQERPNISIQILPYGAGHMMGLVSVLTMPDGVRAAYTEGFRTGAYTEETTEVIRYQRVYDRYAACALTVDASTQLIAEALKRST
ncbi:Scr1 family TA system antitoxin-like transcriptional regulator [Streptomyces sp. NPDC090442]|uniref:helix-turn-helix domain-containing protein n=1 Tax=Streptomyces sp. NPDC090442 TaxID=3365962 RepID=UPI003804249D